MIVEEVQEGPRPSARADLYGGLFWIALGSVPLLESSLGSGLALALLWLLIGRQPRRAPLAAGGDSADD